MDLELLEDINYDVEDIINELLANGCLSLNMIFDTVFRTGIYDLQEVIDNRINELREQEELDEDEKTELEAIENLIVENDVEYFCNCLDTSIDFIDNEKIYRKYFSYDIDDIEDKMGFVF